jgi:hypothetical protein
LLCPPSYTSPKKSSILPVRIEVEGDETTWVF